MRAPVILIVGCLVLAACGDREAEAPTPPVDAVVEEPAVEGLSLTDLRRVCQAGLAAVQGQEVAAIAIDGVEDLIVSASWPAPVDGGRQTAQCRVEGGMIVWKPLNRPVAEENRWMNKAGDPVIRYVLKDDRVVITQLLPEGTNERSELTVPVTQEADDARR